MPTSGIYLFTIDGLLHGEDYAEYLVLRVNGHDEKRMFDGGYGPSYGFHQVTGMYAASLDEGDLVRLDIVATNPTIRVTDYEPLTFMGMLVG